MLKTKKFKKAISALLATTLLCAATVPAIAAETDEAEISGESIYGVIDEMYIPHMLGPFTEEQMAKRRQLLEENIDIAEDDFYFTSYIYSKYTDESCDLYYKRLFTARRLQRDENARYNDMGDAVMDLWQARAGLVLSDDFVPRDALAAVLAEISQDFDYTPEYWYDYYTAESYDNYLAAKQKAEALLSDENTSDEEFINMTEELKTARKALVRVQNSSGNGLDEEVLKAEKALKTEAEDMAYGVSHYPKGLWWYPYWSESTIERFTEFSDSLQNKLYSTMEEVSSDREKLSELKRTATIGLYDLELILSVLEKENNTSGYYDYETWSEFTSVYEECKQAVYSDDEETIHIAYVKACNIFNKLCLYNKTMGDVNNDGTVNVKDATLLQKAVVEEVSLTYSQAFVANYITSQNTSRVPNVTAVTELQRYIVEYEGADSRFADRYVNSLESNPEIEFYPLDRLDYFSDIDTNSNYLYSRIESANKT